MFLVWPLAQVAGIAIAAGLLGATATAAAVGYTMAVGLGAGQALWHWWRVRRSVVIDPHSDGSGEGAWRPMMAVAWPLWAQGVAMALYTWADQVLLAGLRDPAAAGMYGPVATLAPLFGVGLGALNGAFAPMIAKKHADGDLAGLQDLYRVVTRWAVILAIPPVALALGSPLSLLAPWPAASPETAAALQVAAVGQLLCTGVGSVNYLLIMCGRQRDTLYNAIPAVIVNLVASFLLIPPYGVVGAALANALAMGLANLLGLGQVVRHLQIHPFSPALLRCLLAGLFPLAFAVAGEALWGAGWTTLLVAGAAGGVAFLAVYAASGLDPGDRQVLDVLRRKFSR
jgi:O-antigen/teichoic acid export membrane protein